MLVHLLAIAAGRSARALRSDKRLETCDLRVERRNVLADNVRELGNLNRAVIEQSLALGNCDSVSKSVCTYVVPPQLRRGTVG